MRLCGPHRFEGPSKVEAAAAKGAEMLKQLETTSAADIAAAKDARKESAYLDAVRLVGKGKKTQLGGRLSGPKVKPQKSSKETSRRVLPVELF